MSRAPIELHLSLDESADALLSRDPLALLIGMLLDQQITMESAFAGPAKLADRLGTPERLDARMIAEMDPEQFTTLFARPPAVHRFPASMGARVQALCSALVEQYDGDAAAIWSAAPSGKALYDRLLALPGFGEQKARIFVALLGKQLGVRPRGWRQAAGAYGEDGARRSVADVRDAGTLAEVRAFKKDAKAAAKAASKRPS